MIATINNENFGYSTAVDGNWAAVGNPNLLRYTTVSASFLKTGSIEVYKYNINSDTHDLKVVLYRPFSPDEDIYLTTEQTNTGSTGPNYILHTEATGSVPFTADLDIITDAGTNYTASEDGYGCAIDIKNNLLVVGNPYYSSVTHVGTGSIGFGGSGSVDIFDLTKLDIDPYEIRTQPTVVTSSLISGSIYVTVSVPPSQSFGYVVLSSSDTLSGSYQKINSVAVANNGGNILIPTNFTASVYFQVSGIVTVDPYLTSVTNPNPTTTSSYGYSVSMNDEWLAIGSPFESGSKGVVFMYQKIGNNASSWSLSQVISSPASIIAGDKFGYSLELNKMSGSYSHSLVIGTAKPSQSRAFIYEYVSGSWSGSFTLYPDNQTIYPLTFYPTNPYYGSGSTPNTSDGFGHSVGMFKDTVVVGAPTDRRFYEYSGSYLYSQGAVYFFERCPNRDRFSLVKKSYGDEKTLKNNLLGVSVSVRGDYAVAGCPKITLNTSSWESLNNICYLRATLYQQHFCNDTTDATLDGQFVLFNRETSSNDAGYEWDVTNVYQVKKSLLQPYRDYGYSIDICDDFIGVGAPMLISGSGRFMDLTDGTGSFTGSVYDLGDLSGKSYLYNLNNFRENFYVGNVFYRNGKIVIMSSGSSFDGLLLNDLNEDEIEYDIEFKSKRVVYEKQIVCPVEPGEFNVSTNPTAINFPSSSYDLNGNGQFDFQDCDVLLRYMRYKSTETTGTPSTDWSSSVLNTTNDEEITVYAMHSSSWEGTSALFSSSYSSINNTLFTELDFNEDNKIDTNDMSILWKYFTYRLTQKNYDTYITPNSQKKYLSDIIDFLNERTLRGIAPQIKSDFLDYAVNAKADPTGSYLAPYVTSIGLYSGTELVAVAKLGSPIKITPDFPINFIVRMDF
jgi:hypothetical protein